MVGGRGTVIGPIVGCIGIQWLTTALGANQPSGSDWWSKILGNAPLILGIILVAFVLLVPKGLVPTLGDLGQWLLRSRTRRVAASLKPKQAEEGRWPRRCSKPAISACALAASMRYATSLYTPPRANCAA